MALTNEERKIIKRAVSDKVFAKEVRHRGRIRMDNAKPESVKRRERKERQRAREREAMT